MGIYGQVFPLMRQVKMDRTHETSHRTNHKNMLEDLMVVRKAPTLQRRRQSQCMFSF